MERGEGDEGKVCLVAKEVGREGRREEVDEEDSHAGTKTTTTPLYRASLS